MKTTATTRLPLMLLVTAALSASAGCYSSGAYVEPTYVEVEAAPPPPRVERIPYQPGPGYVWVPGFWNWAGGRYVWHAGYWAVPPQTGHVWVPSGWVRHGRHYRYVPGRWSTPGHAHRHYYTPGQRRRPVHTVPPRGRDNRPPPVRR